MKKGITGYLAIVSSALIFGVTPILAAISYGEGNNGINMAFLRAALPIPLFLVISLRFPRPTNSQVKRGVFSGLCLFGCTLMLYSSYQFISPGLATTLHFLYPVYVTVVNVCRKRCSFNRELLIGLTFSVIGIILFLNPGELDGNAAGYALALGSGVMYALYVFSLESEASNPLPTFQLMLIISITGAILCGTVGLLLNQVIIMSSIKAWLYSVIVVLLVAVVACELFQFGVRKTGGTNAAIFSLLEPISSVLFSVLLMGDNMTFQTAAGCSMIMLGLIIITIKNIRAPREQNDRV